MYYLFSMYLFWNKKEGDRMKRIVLFVFPIILLIAFAFFGKTFVSGEPPLPSITVDGKPITVFQGSYCWRGFLGGKCVDMASPPEIIKFHRVVPEKISPESILSINFKNEPLSDSVRANLWISDEQTEELSINDNQLIAPKEKGVYVYDIYARWDKGDASFVFCIEVE